MNNKKMIHTLSLADACIDGAHMPQLLLPLQTIREAFLILLQKEDSYVQISEQLLCSLQKLYGMCSSQEKHPALPTMLVQTMQLLCTPVILTSSRPGLQCRSQADGIRTFSTFLQHMKPLLTLYDEETRLEIDTLCKKVLKLMDEVFHQYLSLYQVELTAKASALRIKKMNEREKYHNLLCPNDVADAAAQSQANIEWMNENIFSPLAEIENPDFLIETKDKSTDLQSSPLTDPEPQQMTETDV